MATESVPDANLSVQRDFGDIRGLQTEAKRQFDTDIILRNSLQGAPNRFEAKGRVLRASDVLLSLVGRSTSETDDAYPGVANTKEALRCFPPFRDDDGTIFGAVDINCPDCNAVFSSLSELKHHYLTKYCPGTAIAVYVMTRDRLITKGYRVEKRFIPLNSRPICFFCGNCERPFTFGDGEEGLDRQRNTPFFVDCKHCGEPCNVSYQPILNDPRDDIVVRGTARDMASANHSRSSSFTQKGSMGSKVPSTNGAGDQSFSKKARKIRDSWSLRKFSQGEEDELVAIGFSGLYDLERVHAPHGIYQQIEGNNEPGTALSTMSYATNGVNYNGSIVESKRTLCEEESGRPGPKNELRSGQAEKERPQAQQRASWRQSFLQRLFGRKVPKGVSRARSTSDRGRKLIKRANTIRFSFVTKYTRSERRAATTRKSDVISTDGRTQVTEPTQESVAETEYMALLRETQNIFIHTQHISGGAIVHDASGRQRILKIDEIAQLFLQIKDELAAASVWSRILHEQMRAQNALNQGNLETAMSKFHNALRLLNECPALDIDKHCRAVLLHSLGRVYRHLERTQEATVCYLTALGLFKRTFGRDHPDNFAILHDLGALDSKDGYATQAAALYERSFAGRLKTLGHNDPETLKSMQDLATLKVALGDQESALLLLEKAAPALDTVFGLHNERTLTAKNQLSLLYHKLELNKEAQMICGRNIPHYKAVFGITSPITREAVIRYLECSENFDFPSEINDILDQYQHSQEPDALRVIQHLGRSYINAGLYRDAANLFESLVEDFLAIKGPEAIETYDALSTLCVSHEQLDSIDKAMLAYKQLVHMARRTPEDRYLQTRIEFAEERILALNGRRNMLTAEKQDWALHEPGPCEKCGTPTTTLCNTCNIFRFCNDKCHKAACASHASQCIPSVTRLESKSIRMKHKCPVPARDLAITRIRQLDTTRPVNITASTAYHLDHRKFTTFRMKLNPDVNTVIVFARESDIRYTMINNPPHLFPPSKVQWTTPEHQESVFYAPASPGSDPTEEARYLLVAPGKKMHRALVDKRVRVRGGGGEKERFRALDIPNKDLIEYAQGLVVTTNYPYEPFMYVFEWVWKD
ncbi:tetratricopeptide repeat protein [Aspergillus vadensis CBS 113365]|uniref:Tetratricopeptide repeat domain protein n=1 Tax=Aspergillus vadensis (strain CBS 113365 / IMI 142717 / IBT 24658) TaxID=1448311 RepID=A0A319B340_ASPVC|nr:tetratricopeptide repeat domain protein [Aspergillus vadensis CBS 113365]PYH66201.1 tetratricopeptide repeat domain protein [Aspergillus vadensis CBS 113365]